MLRVAFFLALLPSGAATTYKYKDKFTVGKVSYFCGNQNGCSNTDNLDGSKNYDNSDWFLGVCRSFKNRRYTLGGEYDERLEDVVSTPKTYNDLCSKLRKDLLCEESNGERYCVQFKKSKCRNKNGTQDCQSDDKNCTCQIPKCVEDGKTVNEEGCLCGEDEKHCDAKKICTDGQHGTCSAGKKAVNPPKPVHGVWSSWSSFGVCSANCGAGVKTRTRKCNNRAHGGKDCTGKASDQDACKIRECPDNVAPTLSITSSDVKKGSTKSNASIALQFDVSEDTALESKKISVANGKFSAAVSGSGKRFTATITPIRAGAVTVTVAEGAFTDTAGNPNEASTFGWTYAAKIRDEAGDGSAACSFSVMASLAFLLL